MLASKLFEGIEYQSNCDLTKIEIKHLSFKTDDITKNTLYFCLKGQNVDGHQFAKVSFDLGANLIVVERFLDVDIPQVLVKNSRKALSLVAAKFFKNPAKKLKIIGITGTNGKTTTTYILKSILNASGFRVGVVGTLGVFVENKKIETNMTTPDPIELHRIFGVMVKNKIDFVVMEVSAHALALSKVFGIKFEVGAITNITQDHLDYFKTFSNYAKTKLDFISSKFLKSAVLNVDDKLLNSVYQQQKQTSLLCVGVGIEQKTDVFPKDYGLNSDGIWFKTTQNGKTFCCKTKLIGKFNLSNLLLSVAVCQNLGIDYKKIQQGIQSMDFVPGRFNIKKMPNGAYVVVDYAHTPDGLQKILSSAKQICKGRLFCVFGCGGNRDTTKRPIMGEIAGSVADFCVLTTDNPRFEDPKSIIIDIQKGVEKVTSNFFVEVDRQKAISYALKHSKKDDMVVVAGKGAENYMEIKGKKIYYSDFDVINSLI